MRAFPTLVVLALSLSGIGTAIAQPAPPAPNVANAGRFVVQAWSDGGVIAFPCGPYACDPARRRFNSVSVGSSACSINIRWAIGAGYEEWPATIDFSRATIVRYQDGIRLSGVNWSNSSVGGDLHVTAGTAMDDRIFAALTDLTRACQDRSLGY